MPVKVQKVRPQKGPQELAMSSPADMLVYGGAAGAGKSWYLIMEPLRFIDNPRFKAAIVRQYSSQIFDQGGLWSEAQEWYPKFGGIGFTQRGVWKFPSGAEIQFRHCEDERSLGKWQGTQVAYLGIDELTHFKPRQFWTMVSRCRSTSGVHPYVRCTCNPDCDSFVADMISWWIDEDTGYPIPERRGVIRWMVQLNDTLYWADSEEEIKERFPDVLPRTFTFVDGSLTDNKVLLDIDPTYMANLQGLPLVERERLLKGNWKIRHVAGGVFDRDWWELREAAPSHFDAMVRYWDKAGTETGDYTAGVLMGKVGASYWVLDVVRGKWTPDKRDTQIRNTAEQDYKQYNGMVHLWFESEPGAAGIEVKAQAADKFAKYGVRFDQTVGKGSKVVRANPFAAQVEHGSVYLKTGLWNKDFMDELAAFPTTGVNDDQVDAAAGAFNKLVTMNSMVPSSYTRGYPNPLSV